jgi:hypothetical protein
MKETKIPAFWEVAMASARKKAKPPPANRKFPGLERFTKMLETMTSAEIARELRVTRHTVTNWVSEHRLKDKAIHIQTVLEQEREARAERRRIAELEHVGKIQGGIAALYAKKRMSDAAGINGWRWTRPWNAQTISAS